MQKQSITKKQTKQKALVAIHEMPANSKIDIIKKGLSKDDLEHIKDQFHLDYSTLSEILAVSRAKLISKKGTEKFDRVTSEKILLLADLIQYGQSVFEDNIAFGKWMKNENRFFEGKKPLDMLSTFYGIQEVKNELGRIEHGVF